MISSLPTIAKAAELIRAGEINPIDLVEFCLARIDRFEEQVQAWVMVDRDGARRLAEEQAELLRQGVDPGPLTGIPIGIKDIIDVAGWPTKAGSPLREDHIADLDATLVSYLRSAGAIILGKTVTTQFACFDPAPTRNPWNLEHTPGGSSSGSAAAVSSEMCMAAIGTQTGGSIIRPASYCGVAGFKPTFRHVSLDGVVPVSKRLDHAGPIARTVSDLAAIYPIVTGSEALRTGPGRHVYNSSEARNVVLTAGLAAAYHMTDFWCEDHVRPSLREIRSYFVKHVSDEVREVFTLAAKNVLTSWSEERALQLPESFKEVSASHYRIMAVEAAAYHRDSFSKNPSAYKKNISALLDDGNATSKDEYFTAMKHQGSFAVDLQESILMHSIAIMPSTNTTAPASLETTGDPKFNSPWSYAGIPSITIPCGIASDGMPCGLQLVGPRDSDVKLLQAAAWCEERLGFELRPPILGE